MADLTEVVLDLARRVVNETGSLMIALERFDVINDWATSAGVNFTDYGTEISEDDFLKHADAGQFNKIVGIITPALITWLQSQTSGAKTFWELLHMTRRA